ncbi:MAG: hypothetical protein QW393_04850, partial [Candidatus Micrarchaeaceae archaeon]
GLSEYIADFTAVTIPEGCGRDVFPDSRNSPYLFLLGILRTYGTYVRFMIEIGGETCPIG